MRSQTLSNSMILRVITIIRTYYLILALTGGIILIGLVVAVAFSLIRFDLWGLAATILIPIGYYVCLRRRERWVPVLLIYLTTIILLYSLLTSLAASVQIGYGGRAQII